MPEPPPHLSTLGDPRAPLARMVAAGLAIAALAVGLLVYGGTRETPEASAERAAAGGDPEAPAPTSLWVNADPAGSAVFVDGDSVGVVPLWLDRVADGARRVRIVSAGGRTLVDTTVEVSAGQVTDLDLAAGDGPFVASTDVPEGAESIAVAPEPEERPERPRPPPPADRGELRVTSDPPGARVLLDGRRIGTTPLAVGDVRPGRHSVTVERRGYQAVERPVTIRPGGVFEAVVDLRPEEVAEAPPPRPAPARPAPAPARPAPPAAASPAPGQTGIVEILVRPWGSIAIDGVTLHEATDVVYRAELAAGVHRVVVANPSYGSDERTITVAPGSRARIEFNLAGGGR